MVTPWFLRDALKKTVKGMTSCKKVGGGQIGIAGVGVPDECGSMKLPVLLNKFLYF